MCCCSVKAQKGLTWGSSYMKPSKDKKYSDGWCRYPKIGGGTCARHSCPSLLSAVVERKTIAVQCACMQHPCSLKHCASVTVRAQKQINPREREHTLGTISLEWLILNIFLWPLASGPYIFTMNAANSLSPALQQASLQTHDCHCTCTYTQTCPFRPGRDHADLSANARLRACTRVKLQLSAGCCILDQGK